MDLSSAEWFINFGALGLVLVLIMTGALVPGWVHRSLERAYEKSQDALAVERQRNADLQQMTAIGSKALAALEQVAVEERERRRRAAEDEVRRADLHAERARSAGEVPP